MFYTFHSLILQEMIVSKAVSIMQGIITFFFCGDIFLNKYNGAHVLILALLCLSVMRSVVYMLRNCTFFHSRPHSSLLVHFFQGHL